MENNIAPVILTAMDLEVSYGQQIILNKASLSIHEGERIGLVGRNGIGKSTFLKVISNLQQPDNGSVAKRKDLIISLLTQEFTLDPNKTVYENVLMGAKNIIDLVNEYEKSSYHSSKRELLEQKLQKLGGWNLEKNIKYILKALNAPSSERNVNSLSGGEKRRVALAKVLIAQPEFLILDEPTNHLDTDSIEWIEKYLSSYKGTCIFVTHDRYFLDRIATRIVELNDGKFISHNGNYTDYLVNKAERETIEETEEKKRLKFLKRELEWVKRGPKARRTKAKSRIDKYNEVLNQDNYQSELNVDLVIPPPEKLGKIILELKKVSMNYEENKLFSELNLLFDKNRKLGIIGKNGTGKTTLLKIIIGELSPTSGEIITGEKTKFNYVDQSRLLLNDEDTVIDAISDGNNFIKFGDQQITVWSYLKKFLFTDDRINTKVGRLSGGEKSRLTLAKVLKKGGNFLILDEPTNDLDLPTLRILEEAIISFNGCVILVSHDRYFLNRVCNGILAFEDDEQVFFSEGNYDYYLEKKNNREIELKSTFKKNIVNKNKLKEKPKKLSYKEKKELEAIEENILSAEDEVKRIENIFSDPELYLKYAEKSKELTIELEIAKEKVAALFDRWEELENIEK